MASSTLSAIINGQIINVPVLPQSDNTSIFIDYKSARTLVHLLLYGYDNMTSVNKQTIVDLVNNCEYYVNRQKVNLLVDETSFNTANWSATMPSNPIRLIVNN